METIYVYTDGGSRGNPGISGAGVYIHDTQNVIVKEVSKFLGRGTNNFAEYEAVVLALETLYKIYGKRTKEMLFEIRMDSELIQRQLSGQYQIKDPGLIPLYMKIHNFTVAHFPNVAFVHVRREQNKEADRLANQAMDNKR